VSEVPAGEAAAVIIFFYGSNHYELRQELHKLRQSYVKRAGSDLGLERLDGAKLSSAELAGAIQSAPFLVRSRLVIIDGLGGNKAVAAALPKLLEQVPPTTVLVLAEPEIDRRTSYYKQVLAAADQSLEFKPLQGPVLEGWVRKEAARLGARITPQAVRRLVELAGEDQWRLAGELNKLTSYQPAIDVPEVERLVEPGFSETIFSLVDAMTAGRAASALKLYRGLLQQRTAELYILSMIQWQLRNLLFAKASGGMAPPELAKRAGLSPYVASKAAAKQRDFREDVLKQAVVAAADCEYRVKRGELPSEEAVEQLIWQIAALAAS
jgi:DNA polymerase III subunit delta